MGSLIEFPDSSPTRRPAAWGLATELVDTESTETQSTRGRRAVVRIGELATVCVVAEVPAVGDTIHGELSAVVEKVRVTRDGIVHVYARAVLASEPTGEPPAGRSPRVASVLAELRRRRLSRENRVAGSLELTRSER